MQHMDDCINILRGFTVDRRDFDKSRHVKVYRRAVDQYRSHIGKVADRDRRIRRGLDAMFSQNIGDGAPGYGMAEIREGAANACIPRPVPKLGPFEIGHKSAT